MGANAQTSVPDFTAGQVLTAQQQTEINTGIPVFATSVERDAAFGGTGEKVLAEGQFAFLEDTNATQFYDGSTWQPVGVAPGLVLVKSQVVGSAVASVEVTGAFSATYDNYKITYTGGVGSTGTGITMILGATTTGYYSALIYGSSYGASGPTYTGTANGASWTFVGIASTNAASVNMEINNPFLTVNTLMSHSRSDAATAGTAGTGQGYLANSTSYTGFTLTPQSGTLTGGTIRVYGYANS
jgi:hypothetical protein